MTDMPIAGYCHDRFAPVKDAFVENMAADDPEFGREIGACVSVVIDGQTVVDLWGGFKDAARTSPWGRETITCMMSVTKASASLCCHMLCDRGAIDLAERVAAYWPEFAANGKAEITVRTLLSHQAALLFADAAPPGSLWQADIVERALEQQAPEWEPGTAGAYHSFTYGPLVGALVRRVSGRTIGQFFRDEIAAPLRLDFQIGLNDNEIARCADFIETAGTPSLEGIKRDETSPLYRAWRPMPAGEDFNSDNWRRKEFASANGHGNARAIALLYGVLARGGEIDGVRILSQSTIDDVIGLHWDGQDRMTNRHFRFGAGFMLSCPPMPLGGHQRNFGHFGIGGALGFADPERKLGFGYCGNRMTPTADDRPFARNLVDALYRAVG